MKNSRKTTSASVEDYLETILVLSEDGEGARPAEIAQAHKVSRATVTDALSRLGRDGLVVYEKYRPVKLTPRGRDLADKTLKKHKVLLRFLTRVLGISESRAEESACMMEHAIDANIADKLAAHLDEYEAESVPGRFRIGRVAKLRRREKNTKNGA